MAKKEVVPKAKKDRAEKIALTMQAQGNKTGAERGTPEFDKGTDPADEKVDKAGRGKQDNTNIGGD